MSSGGGNWTEEEGAWVGSAMAGDCEIDAVAGAAFVVGATLCVVG